MNRTKTDLIFLITGLLMLFSEICKQLTLTFVLGAGQYDWWYFPFQLCSIPMYILLAYPWIHSAGIKTTLLCFLMCYGLLGGIAVFADTTGMHYPLDSLTVLSYAWHICLIFIGVYTGFTFIRFFRTHNKRTLFSRALRRAFPLRPFLYASCLYLLCCLIAVLLNLMLNRLDTVNLFYINPDYKMQQIIFRDLVPVLGNNNVLILYIFCTVLGAFLIFLIWKFIFTLTARG